MNEREQREQLNQLSPLQRATLAVKTLRARLDAVTAQAHEPIAVVGMSCRFPGGANSPEALWQLLRQGGDGTSDVPDGRWDRQAFYSPDPDAVGRMYVTRSGFLRDWSVDGFDAGLFRLSPLEANGLDPQQRMLLELSWEALEDAGLAADRLVGSQTGVFVGIATNDYGHIAMQAGFENLSPYVGTGNAMNTAAGRLSFFFGFRGPTLALDTACSSSLAALHLAIHSLRRGESSLCLVAGVNLILSPMINVFYSRMRALAPDGRCKAFDAAADGMVRGEGGAVLVLKRGSDAQRDGDRVLALLRGSACNHDGHASGLTVPSGTAQRQVLRAALADAQLAPHDVTFVEAHGTGTPLGDPIEANALIDVLGSGRRADAPLFLGSAKANVGHLEAAAGLVGLIKAVQMLRHREIPPQPHFQRLNPQIQPGPGQDAPPLCVPTGLLKWPDDRPPIIGVSSFGMSGTNVHLLLSAPPESEAVRPPPATPQPLMLALSAASQPALQDLARRYRDWLTQPGLSEKASAGDVVALCAGALRGRARLGHRLAVAGRSATDLRAALDAYLAREIHPRVAMGQAPEGPAPRVAFVFSGHSGHHVGMGRDLWTDWPPFREAFSACEDAFAPFLDRPLQHELFADDAPTRWSRPDVVQPLVFALQVGLAATWRSLGMLPDAVVGHSMGEIAAAHVAGALSLADAARLCALRSRLLAGLQGQGAMAVVAMPMDEAQALLRGREGQLGISAENGPMSTVLGGDATALQALLTELAARNVFTRRVAAGAAGHSPQMDPLLPELVRALQPMTAQPATLPLYSTVTGERLCQAPNPDYWAANLRQPVLFARTIAHMAREGCDAFVELGPSPLLLGAIEQTLRPKGGSITLVPSHKAGEAGLLTLATSLAKLFASGVEPDPQVLYAGTRPPLDLPKYPFVRERHWVDVPAFLPADQRCTAGQVAAGSEQPVLPSWQPMRLQPVDDPHTLYWQVTLPAGGEVLRGLSLQGVRVLPLGVLWRLALTATAEHPATWLDLDVLDALPLPVDHGVELQAVLRPCSGADPLLSIHGCSLGPRPGDAALPYRPLLRARLRTGQPPPDEASLGQVLARCQRNTPNGASDAINASETIDALLAPLRARGLRIDWSLVSNVEQRPADGQPLPRLSILPGPDGQASELLIDVSPPLSAPGLDEPSPASDMAPAAALAHRAALADALSGAWVELLGTGISFLSGGRPEPPVFGDVLWPTHAHLWVGAARGNAAPIRYIHISRRSATPTAATMAAESGPPGRVGSLSPHGDVDLFDGAGQRVGSLRGLTLAEPPRSLSRLVVAQRFERWTYEQTWPEQPLTSLTTKGPRAWLIVADQAGLAEALADLLRKRGDVVLWARPSDGLRLPTATPLTWPAGDATALASLLRQVSAALPATMKLHGVVALFAADDAHTAQATPLVDRVNAAVQAGPQVLLDLVQALPDAAPEARLVLVTQRAQSGVDRSSAADAAHTALLGAGDAVALQSMVWGMGKVIALEHPACFARMVDVDLAANPVPNSAPDLTPNQAPAAGLGRALCSPTAQAVLTALCNELSAALQPSRADDEDFVALRPGRRHVLRLARANGPAFPSTPLSLRPDAQYLITGGISGIGHGLARWLADRGARHIAVVARRPLPAPQALPTLPADGAEARALRLIASLHARGVEVTVFAADVADEPAMQAVLTALGDRPLAGVLHAAGVSDPRALSQTDAAQLGRLLRPKVLGTLVLDRLLQSQGRARDLDFFVCFSSAAAVWGGAGLGPYAAANQFMDELAAHRQRAGRPMLSINWGGWAGYGMATEEVQRIATQMGLYSVPADQMVEALDAVLQSRRSGLTIGPIDWSRFKPVFEARKRRPLFDRPDLVAGPPPEPSPDADSNTDAAAAAFVAQLRDLPAVAARLLLHEHVRAQAAQVLGIADATRLLPDQGFFQLGMDSVMSIRLRNGLERSLQQTLPPTLAFEHPTVDRLASYLAEILSLPAVDDSAVLAAATTAAPSSLDTLSEEDLTALLLAELGSDSSLEPR